MILLVEDDPPSSRAITLALKTTGHEVMSAGDGTEAMELLHKHDFELDVTPDSSKLQAGFQPVR